MYWFLTASSKPFLFKLTFWTWTKPNNNPKKAIIQPIMYAKGISLWIPKDFIFPMRWKRWSILGWISRIYPKYLTRMSVQLSKHLLWFSGKWDDLWLTNNLASSDDKNAWIPIDMSSKSSSSLKNPKHYTISLNWKDSGSTKTPR